MSDRDGNVAFKCTYNDGGALGFVGFGGTCTKDNIKRNVKRGRSWCSHEENHCRQFYEDGLKGIKPVLPCYESKIVTKWEFGPGGDKHGNPNSINYARKGKVALLTTRHPDHDSERQRIVFGAFKIVEIAKDDGGIMLIKGKPASAILLPEAAMRSLPFWRFKTYPRNGKPTWGSRLFRYLSDQEVANFLHALRPSLHQSNDRKKLEQLLKCCIEMQRDSAQENADVEVTSANSRPKFGSGGEGERHRELKEFIGDNPDRLGLGPGKGSLELSFVTGDRVDVVVELASGDSCVVEVEVEGQSTMIGAHQALKYRALLAGHLNMTKQPHAFLVAYSIPENVKRFCKRHGVQALEMQPD